MVHCIIAGLQYGYNVPEDFSIDVSTKFNEVLIVSLDYFIENIAFLLEEAKKMKELKTKGEKR